MKIPRRKFLLGASSALAIVSTTPSLNAMLLRGGLASAGPSGFNGGLTQGQSVPSSTDFPFLNYFKGTLTGWQGTDSFNNNQLIDPSWLAADGWPLASALQAHSTSGNGVFMGVAIPPPTSYTGTNGNLCLIWTVTGAGPSDTVVWGIGLQGVTPVSSSVISGTGSVSGTVSTGTGTFMYKFIPSYSSGNSFNFNLQQLNGTSHVTSAALVFDGQDYTDYAAGKIFSRQFTNQLTLAGFGAYRFMDWIGTNITNATTWATRKSMDYVTWFGDEYRANLSAGVTSGNVGNDYSVTIPGTYVWSGPNGTYVSGGAPVDKQTMHMRFNVDSTYVANMQTNDGSGGASTLTIGPVIGASSPIIFTWPSCPLSNGDPLCIYNNGNGGNSITGVSPSNVYYVVGLSGNTFNIATTKGGAAVSTTNIGQGNVGVTRLPTLTIDGVNKIPIMGGLSSPITTQNQRPLATIPSSTVQLWGTLTYDAALNSWMLLGATNQNLSVGLLNAVPIEACFALCQQLGMYPHFSLPGLALDPATDYATSLATYIKSNAPWMIPHFEPANEIWNPTTQVTQYSQAKSFCYWDNSGSLHDWYGMVVSLMGQAIATVYGLGNLGTTYEVLCGVKTADGLNPTGGSQDPRLGPSQWTIQNQPAQSGYTIQQARLTTSAIAPATYTSPSMRGEPDEYLNAWGYYVANVGNPTAQMANLNAFIDTLSGPSGQYNNQYNLDRYNGFKTWAATFGVNKMIAYEGGYSPDLIGPSGNDWNSPITGATNATQCVLTLATTNGGDNFSSHNGVSGNCAAVGQCLFINGVNGMTQLNCPSQDNSGFGRVTFVTGASIISMTNNFVANQGIVFPSNNNYGEGQTYASNIQVDVPYYILAAGLSSSQFQISATLGGSPIIFTNPAGVTSVQSSEWFVGWVVTNVSGNSVTIACDSSAFGSYSANSGTAFYAGSRGLINGFRIAARETATHTQAQLKANYDNFIGAGGLFPSQYEFAGDSSIWPIVYPTIYSSPGQAFQMIQHYNGH